jgi:dihydrofolate reductase
VRLEAGSCVVRHLREEAGKDIWLFGGGSLFRGLRMLVDEGS